MFDLDLSSFHTEPFEITLIQLYLLLQILSAAKQLQMLHHQKIAYAQCGCT